MTARPQGPMWDANHEAMADIVQSNRSTKGVESRHMSSATAVPNKKAKYRFQTYEMTLFQWIDLYLAWDQAPRCYICGKFLHVGDRWRWFFNQPNDEGQWLPVFGCAEHGGERVYVWGKWLEVPPIYSS